MSDLITWAQRLLVEHPDADAERLERLELACAWAVSRRTPLVVGCGRTVVAEAGWTPSGVLLVCRLRGSDVEGMIRWTAESRPRPPVAFTNVSLAGPSDDFTPEPLEAVADVLWWPAGVEGPTWAPTRCRDHHHRLDLSKIVGLCRAIPRGEHARATMHEVEAQS